MPEDESDRRDAAAASTRRAAPLAIATAIAVAIVCTTLAVISAYDPSFETRLDYRRSAIAAGSLHRLVTAHFVHLSSAHAALDIAGLLLVAWIFASALTAGRLAVVTLAAIAAIDGSLWLFHPEIDRYAGLSGVLHGWFAAGAVGWALAARRADASVAKRAWGVALLVGLAIKLMLEQRGQSFWLGADAMPIVTSAHRWGAAAGAGCAVLAVALGRAVRRRAIRAGVAS